VHCLSPQQREMPRPGTTRLCPAESHGPSREWIAAGCPPPGPPARPLSETDRLPSRASKAGASGRRGLPPSAFPPARLSQDSNILSSNLTDGAGCLRYIPHVRVEPCLACLGALVLHVAERIAGVVPLVVLVLLVAGRFRGRAIGPGGRMPRCTRCRALGGSRHSARPSHKHVTTNASYTGDASCIVQGARPYRQCAMRRIDRGGGNPCWPGQEVSKPLGLSVTGRSGT
jgi:hypothetical protein